MVHRRGRNAFIIGAAAVVVAHGIAEARPVLSVVLLAGFLAVTTAPLVLWLKRRRVPTIFAVAAGLLVGSVAPATALPGEPGDDHCARIERFEEVALARIGRFETLIARFEAQIERIESRAEQGPTRARPAHAGPEGRPAQAGQAERRLERMNAKIERFENRIAAITARYDAIALHCGADPLFPGDEDPAPTDTGSDTPVDGIVAP